MAGPSKFKFPMPHRRSRQQPSLEVQTISSPMTNKAHKLLGSAELNIDPSPTSSIHDPRLWETRSAVSGVSGISVTISETTATGTVNRTRSPLSTLDEGTVATNSRGHGKAAWDQESDIIPKGLGFNGSTAGRTQNMDTITDASSVRRRRSSSTIASFYDKTKLPLSISQQTSNSAMAKGPPNKSEFLDMDSPRPAPSPPTMERKKPAKLDMTHLLPSSATPSRNPLTRLARKRSMVLGPDMLTRSPSVVSTSPAASPLEAEPKQEKKPRRKLTRESLRSLRSLGNRHSTISTEESETASVHMRATDAGTLNQLYQHYENTSFRDTMTPDEAELEEESPHGEQIAERESRAGSRQRSRQSSVSSATPIKTRHYVSSSSPAVSRHHFSPNSTFDAISEMPPSASNPALASPPTDYAGSVSSRHTRTSKASKWTDQSFTDFDPNANSVLSLSSDSEDDFSEPPRTAVSAPSIASLESTSSPPESRRPSNTSQESVRKQLKSKFRPSLNPQGHFLAIPENMNTTGAAQPAISPRTSSPKKHNSPRIDQPTPPMSPSSMEFVIKNQHKPTTEKEGPVVTLNGTGGAEDERFMAVTKQEEMLLAAMRARRALMRESNQIADVEGMDRVRVQDDKTASKKESLSSIKTVKVKANKLQPPPTKPRPSEATAISSDTAITMLFPNPPSGRSSPTVRADGTPERISGKQEEEVLVCLDRTTSPVQPLKKAEPISELSDFMRFESEQFPAPPVSKPSHNRVSGAPKGCLSRTTSARQKSTPRRDSDFMALAARPSSVQGYRKPELSSRSASRSDWRPAEVEPVIERPESASSFYESEPETQPPPRMKAVRISAVGISAVGTQLPEIGQWGDDG
ncbi:hypothetical protein VMCG_03263 [Cytospora schulzeri]|uniref:Uncharacterized protein n=1 Tax=Cytospora schulzeri TaxID=448051 RepID=A0A423WY14_9PEZI|nr:hypothetical protein VMCG_03263 [Valsa malicola]